MKSNEFPFHCDCGVDSIVPNKTGKQYPTEGVGTDLTRYLEHIGAVKDGCGSCHHHALLMNAWGPERCWEHRDQIVGWLRKAYRERPLLQRIQIATAVSIGVLKGESISLRDPYLSALKHVLAPYKVLDSSCQSRSIKTH